MASQDSAEADQCKVAANRAAGEGQVTLSSPMRGMVFKKNSAVHTMSASKTHSSCRASDEWLVAKQLCILAKRGE